MAVKYHSSIQALKPEERGIAERVVDVVYESLNLDSENGNYQDKSKIGLDTNLSADLGADSLDIAELTMEIEDKFNIDIPREAMKGFESVGNIVSYIAQQPKP